MKLSLDLIHLITLIETPNLGRKSIASIIKHLRFKPHSIHDLLDIIKEAKIRNSRIRVPVLKDLENAYFLAETILQTCQEKNIKILTQDHLLYPRHLFLMENPPLVLYALGHINLLNANHIISITGTRTPDTYGLNCAKRLAKLFLRKDFTLISGLSKGCEQESLNNFLKAHRQVIAVIPGGVEAMNQESNQLIKSILAEKGCILSEHPPERKFSRGHIPAKNQLISCLSGGIIISQTGPQGGSIQQVESALKLKKPVGCVVSKTEQDDWFQKGYDFLIHQLNCHALGSGEEIDAFESILKQAPIPQRPSQPHEKMLPYLKAIIFDLEQILLNAEQSQIYQDIPKMLHEIKALGLKVIVITTSKIKALHPTLLPYCDLLISPTNYKKPKPNPESLQYALDTMKLKLNEVIFVGDSAFDMMASKAINIYAIGAEWGALDRKSLFDAQPDFICETPSQLLEQIKWHLAF